MKLRVMLLIAFFAIVVTTLLTDLAFKYVSYNTIKSVPAPVLQQYNSYESPRDLSLYKCSHESQTVYQVVLNGGYGGETYQYNQEGVLLGVGYWGDDLTRSTNPPINLQKSDCQVVSERGNVE